MIDSLAIRARRADALISRGREELVSMIRQAHVAGMSQREIAKAVGRSQPEVNRLLRFHGTTPNGVALRKARPEVISLLRSAGLVNPRVFGSSARGEDSPDSDIDLLVTPKQSVGLLAQTKLENRLREIIGASVDLVLDNSLRPDLEQRIISEAVPL